jgi:uncharacterized protein YndB with AHSA1/START domain
MGQIVVSAAAKSAASPARVFALLKDGSSWPQWSLFDAFVLERQGAAEPLGVGAIRVFITKVSKAREEVVELIPDRRLSYILLSGLPLTHYRADVDLEPGEHGGTVIHWRSRFGAKHLGTGWLWKWLMRRTLQTVANQLAEAAANPTIAPKAGGAG